MKKILIFSLSLLAIILTTNIKANYFFPQIAAPLSNTLKAGDYTYSLDTVHILGISYGIKFNNMLALDLDATLLVDSKPDNIKINGDKINYDDYLDNNNLRKIKYEATSFFVSPVFNAYFADGVYGVPFIKVGVGINVAEFKIEAKSDEKEYKSTAITAKIGAGYKYQFNSQHNIVIGYDFIYAKGKLQNFNSTRYTNAIYIGLTI